MSGFVGWMMIRPIRAVASRPMCFQVSPASVDLKTPMPMETFARMKVSPVPAQTMFGSDSETASAPMAWTSWSSNTGRHLMPPSSVFQMPPVAAPA